VTGREGLATLLWRNDGAGVNNTTTYLYQSLGSKLKPSSVYKIKFHVLTHNQARSCNWRVGVGSTSGGYEYSLNVFNTVNTNFTSKSYEYTFVTPSVVASETFFTIGNNGDATSGNWTIIHLDRITLAEGSATKGITGVTSASYLEGTAYAPENLAVDFANGDYIDYTSVIVNPSFEVNGAAGWTNVGGFGPQTNASFPYKAGNVYFEKWQGSGNWTGLKISQKILNLPNGDYRVIAGALNNPETTGGAFIFANAAQVEVFTSKDYKLKVTVTNNEIDLGYRVDNGGNYVATDNYRLYMLSDGSPYMAVDPTALVFNPTTLVKTFEVTGGYLTADATLVAPAGITLSKTTLTAAEVAAGVIVTATFDNATVISNGSITITSGSLNKTISVNTSIDPVLSTSISSARFDEVLSTGSFTVSGSNIASDISITAPAGITVNPTSIPKGTGTVNAVSVSVTYDGTTPNISGNIVVTSGVATKNIAVVAALNSNNYTPLYVSLTNIMTNTYCNSLDTYTGWGTQAAVSDYVYSGARSIKVTGKCGGSLDYNLTGKVEGNKTYRVKAMVSTNGTGEVKIGISGATATAITQTISTAAGQWLPLEFNFTTQATVGSGNMFLNSCETQTATESYIDNYEMYDVTSIVTGAASLKDNSFNAFVRNNKIVVVADIAAEKTAQINVYNVNGMLIASDKVTGNSEHTLNANISNGVYFVRIQNDGKLITKKIVK